MQRGCSGTSGPSRTASCGKTQQKERKTGEKSTLSHLRQTDIMSHTTRSPLGPWQPAATLAADRFPTPVAPNALRIITLLINVSPQAKRNVRTT